MGRWRNDRQTQRNRTRSHDQGGYDGREYGQRGYSDGRDSERYYEDRYAEDRYYRDRDTEREHYYRDREQRQQTRRTGMMIVGGIVIALIALFGVMAITGDNASQTAQQTPQQAIPQQPAPQQQPAQPQQPQAPAAPSAPQVDPASSEQVEGMRADIERQLLEIRQSINELRLQIWSWFGSERQNPEQ